MQGTFTVAGTITFNKTNACLRGNKSINNINQIVNSVLKREERGRVGRKG